LPGVFEAPWSALPLALPPCPKAGWSGFKGPVPSTRQHGGAYNTNPLLFCKCSWVGIRFAELRFGARASCPPCDSVRGRFARIAIWYVGILVIQSAGTQKAEFVFSTRQDDSFADKSLFTQSPIKLAIHK